MPPNNVYPLATNFERSVSDRVTFQYLMSIQNFDLASCEVIYWFIYWFTKFMQTKNEQKTDTPAGTEDSRK